MAILFAEALEAVEKLDDDGQLELAELIRRRVAERGRVRGGGPPGVRGGVGGPDVGHRHPRRGAVVSRPFVF